MTRVRKKRGRRSRRLDDMAAILIAMQRTPVTARAGTRKWPLGSAYLMLSFVETIKRVLNTDILHPRYPVVGQGLDRVTRGDHVEAMRELPAIAADFERLLPEDAAWLGEAEGLEPPSEIAAQEPPAATLADVFRTPDGERLVDVLRVALAHARERKKDLELR